MDVYLIKDSEITTSDSLSEHDSALFVNHNQPTTQPAEVMEVDDEDEEFEDLPAVQQEAMRGQALENIYRRRKTLKTDLVRAKKTWYHAHNKALLEPERDSHGYKYWYCKHCKGYSSTSLTSARQHLTSFHDILIEKEALEIDQGSASTINSLFSEQVRNQQANMDESFRRKLRAIVDKTLVEKASVTLTTRRTFASFYR